MDLFSLLFLVFVGLSVFLYYTVCKRHQWVCLLAASLCYYAICGMYGFPFLLTTALTTWIGGMMMTSIWDRYNAAKKGGAVSHKNTIAGESARPRTLSREEKKALKQRAVQQKRLVLVAVLLINLEILAWVKYAGDLQLRSTSLLLPLGISFYTFQSIGYLADVYNNKYPAEKHFGHFLLFVSWFPQLLQGPIGRFDKLRPQFTKQHTYDSERTARALLLILYGLVKKYAIADMLAPSIAGLFDGPVEGIPGSLAVFGILMYSAQQYADFSGGIDIMRGVSALYGITLAQNFRQPYFSTSLGDFWRRWHISLGAFMRDYVFYPIALTKPMQGLSKWLKKNTKATRAATVIPAAIANVIVFFLVGIWHGAQLHYVIWGLYNGLVIAASDLTAPFWITLSAKLKLPVQSRGFHVFRILRTFVIVNIGWYFDRIADMRSCMICLQHTFFAFNLYDFGNAFQRELLMMSETFSVLGGFAAATIGILIVFGISLQRERGVDVAGRWLSRSAAYKLITALGMILLLFASFLFTVSAGGFMYANF